MVSNQTEFNEKYPQEVKEIKLKAEDFDEERLVIENYPNLERLCLKDIDIIDKIILKNLEWLQECTIWDCGMKELIIENCLQIKKLNVRSNSLTNLEFLISLKNLEELEINGNTQLIEILKPYSNDWKSYQKDLQKIFELVKKNNPQELAKIFWDLKKSREDLKKDVSILLSKEIQQKATSKEINTRELVLNLGEAFKGKEARISYLECQAQELINLIRQQKEKIVQAYLTHFGSEKELANNLIEAYLESTKFKKQDINSPDYYEKCKEYKKKYEEAEENLQSELSREDRKKVMNGVQRILTDCEKLVEWELELEINLDNKSLLIREKKQNLTNNDEKLKTEKQEAIQQEQEQSFKRERSNSVVSEIAKLQGQLIAKQEEINYLREKSLTPIPETHVIINSHNTTIEKGHALIGNNLGDDTNLSYQLNQLDIEALNTQSAFLSPINVQGDNNQFGTVNKSENNYLGDFINQDGNMLIGEQQFRDGNSLIVNELPEQELQSHIQIPPK